MWSTGHPAPFWGEASLSEDAQRKREDGLLINRRVNDDGDGGDEALAFSLPVTGCP